MYLTKLSSLKTRLGIEAADTKDDAILNAANKGLSERLQGMCNRQFSRTVGATFEFRADEMDLRVDRYPIESVSAFHLKESEAGGWVEQTEIDFLLSPARSIVELFSPLGSSRQIGRITFTGGYVLPGTAAGSGQTALPDDFEQAVIEQIAYWYQRRNQLGLVSVSGDGGSISQFANLDLLPNCKAVWSKYERMLL